MSQQISFSFAEPRRGAYPYIREYSSSGLFRIPKQPYSLKLIEANFGECRYKLATSSNSNNTHIGGCV